MNLDALRRPTALYPLLGGLLLTAALYALCSGPLALSPAQVLAALGLPTGASVQAFESTTVLQIRAPRIVLALLIGAALAQAGAAMQGIFRNPLAEPGLLGVSSGAALAAVAVIVLGNRIAPDGTLPLPWLLPLATFAGGAVATFLVARLAQVDGTTRVATLLLAGLAINAIAGAGIGFLAHLADDLALRSLTFWMFGSLGKAGWDQILVALPLLLVPLLLIPRDARALNALLLGEAEAGHLGIHVERLKRRLTLLVVMAAGAAVALAGIIGFVGLVVPHLVRLWAGPDHRLLLPASALLGALLLVLADTAARLLLAPVELPIGILTALVGGPFFLALLLRVRGHAESL
ncbi:MAG: FecCD family ABC transporter permease [Gammaproteobacteria bacterium]